RHRDAGLTGSAEDYGVAVAIVLGDLALSWAEQIAARVDGEPGAVAAARSEFDALRTEVMSGQFLDILHQAGGFASAADAEQAALSVIRWKTVPYTVLRPVRIGAALMGGSQDALETLAGWAVEVGTAFQLRDDLLSVVGDQEETGKPIGGDIVEGKRTVLLARTEAATDAAGRALLAEVVGRAESSAQQIAAVHDLMVSTGAVGSVVKEVRQRAGERARASARRRTARRWPRGRWSIGRPGRDSSSVNSQVSSSSSSNPPSRRMVMVPGRCGIRPSSVSISAGTMRTTGLPRRS